MNTAINQNHGMGNGIAFLFGAAFNLLANVNLLFLLDYALQAIVGGIICLAFKIIADVFSPLWQKHKDRVKDFAKLKRVKRLKLRRKKRNDQE
ncbi:MAG TPA: hypothetical protein PKO16_01370 [Bacteroidia bacterium]|nr:hypothetical protein [Bacteroidia bacterium]